MFADTGLYHPTLEWAGTQNFKGIAIPRDVWPQQGPSLMIDCYLRDLQILLLRFTLTVCWQGVSPGAFTKSSKVTKYSK